MKTRYWLAVIALILLTFYFGYVIYNAPKETQSSWANAFQITSLLAAGIALIIALQSGDPKTRPAQLDVHVCKIELAHSVSKAKLANKLKGLYDNFPDPIEAYRIHFKLTNISNFDLTKPSFTFRVPLAKQHPTKDGKKRDCHSNIYNIRGKAVTLKMSNALILCNTGLPYLNKGEDVEFWIKMALSQTTPTFDIKISVNCENADGTTQEITVNPKEVIESAEV